MKAEMEKIDEINKEIFELLHQVYVSLQIEIVAALTPSKSKRKDFSGKNPHSFRTDYLLKELRKEIYKKK